MRQIDQAQLGPVAYPRISAAQRAIHCVQGSPAFGPQKVWNGKRPRSSARARSHSPSGVAGDAEDLIAVGPIIGLRGHADLDGRPLVEPPEELGRAELQPALDRLAPRRHVDRLGLDECVRLLPEPNLARVAEQPAVADDAVLLGKHAGQNAGLSRAGDGRHDLIERPEPARFGQLLQARRECEQLAGSDRPH